MLKQTVAEMPTSTGQIYRSNRSLAVSEAICRRSSASSTIGIVGPETVRVLRATDTMRLDKLYASPALVEEARERSDLRVLAEPSPIRFKTCDFVTPTPHEADTE